MRFWLLLLVVAGIGLTLAQDAHAFHFRRQRAVVAVHAPVVAPVVVGHHRAFVRQRAFVAQPFVHRRAFVAPVYAQPFVAPVVVPQYGVQSFSAGGCAGFFGGY